MMLAVLENCLKSGNVGGVVLGSRITAIPSCVQLQSVRNYPRKPRWIPIAKSKMYKMMITPVIPKLELEEYTAIRSEYELYNRSLWNYQSKISQEQEIQMQKEARQVSEEVELEKMIKINDAENEKVRKIREAAVVEEWKHVEQEILNMKRQKEEEKTLKIQEAETFIQSELERLKGAIPIEDLDTTIEKAMSIETDYNFAVSKDGKYFHGRYNSTDGVDNPTPSYPISKPFEAAK